MIPQLMAGAVIAVRTLLGVGGIDDGSFTATRIEALILECGYATSPVIRATAGPFTSLPWVMPLEPNAEPLMFFARDPEDLDRSDGRLITILVFPDDTRALRAYAAALEQSSASPPTVALTTASSIWSDTLSPDRGPALVQGTGPSVWRGPIAAFQLLVPPEPTVLEVAVQLRREGTALATATPDQVSLAVEHARADLKPRFRDDFTASPYGIDRDVVDCLDGV